MSKKQKRYCAAFEIQAEILAYRQKATRKLAKAIKLEDEARAIIKEANLPDNETRSEFMVNQAKELRDHADKLRRSHLLIHEEYIPKLVRTMGAFKTGTMPFMTDNAVTLQT